MKINDYLQKIVLAKKILNLPDEVSLLELKECYRKLLLQWHPDLCKNSRNECKEKTQEIVEAYDVMYKYIISYKISLNETVIKNDTTNDEQKFWEDRFGSDPHWGAPI